MLLLADSLMLMMWGVSWFSLLIGPIVVVVLWWSYVKSTQDS